MFYPYNVPLSMCILHYLIGHTIKRHELFSTIDERCVWTYERQMHTHIFMPLSYLPFSHIFMPCILVIMNTAIFDDPKIKFISNLQNFDQNKLWDME